MNCDTVVMIPCSSREQRHDLVSIDRKKSKDKWSVHDLVFPLMIQYCVSEEAATVLPQPGRMSQPTKK